jgi:hypothetical protein
MKMNGFVFCLKKEKNQESTTNLREITDNMSASLVYLAQDVEKERFHVKVQGFVVKEKFGNETKILSVDFVLFPVGFVDGKRAFSVDFFAWRLPQRALALWTVKKSKTIWMISFNKR